MIILCLLISGISFANNLNKVVKKEKMTLQNSTCLEWSTNKFIDSYTCTVSCYAIVTNTETGESLIY